MCPQGSTWGGNDPCICVSRLTIWSAVSDSASSVPCAKTLTNTSTILFRFLLPSPSILYRQHATGGAVTHMTIFLKTPNAQQQV